MAKKDKVEKPDPKPLVAVVMGSKSDWDTMRHADDTLSDFGIEHESRVISAHRSPSLAAEFGSTAESRGLEVVIAAAGGAAHLAGVLAAHTTLPVLGVPMTSALNGLIWLGCWRPIQLRRCWACPGEATRSMVGIHCWRRCKCPAESPSQLWRSVSPEQ